MIERDFEHEISLDEISSIENSLGTYSETRAVDEHLNGSKNINTKKIKSSIKSL
jgi:hypothetical protein